VPRLLVKVGFAMPVCPENWAPFFDLSGTPFYSALDIYAMENGHS